MTSTRFAIPPMRELAELSDEQIPATPAPAVSSHADPAEPTAEHRGTTPDLPAPGPCPPWCALPAGHPYEVGDVRWHSSAPGSGDSEVSQLERWEHGVAFMVGPPAIQAWINGDQAVDDLTVAQAREAARGLLAAADLLERIERDTASYQA